MNIYIFFAMFFIIGVVLIVVAFNFYKKYFNTNDIFSFPIKEKSHISYLTKGRYSIKILGGGTVDNFPLRIVAEDNNKIPLYINVAKPRFIKNGNVGVEYFNFEIPKDGTYALVIKDLEKVRVRLYAPIMLAGLREVVSPDHLTLIVKEYSAPLDFLKALLAGVIGFSMLLISFMTMIDIVGIFDVFGSDLYK